MFKKTIVIDAGHGGTDRSNIGYSGKYIEADGNLEFALYLRDYLKDYFNVILTRDKDVSMTLTNRGNMAKGADMFISVHSDAASSTTAGGVTVLGSVKLNNTELLTNIGKAISNSMGINFRRVWRRESITYPGMDYYTVIGTAQRVGCPVVMILERGFHSNPLQERLLLDSNVVKSSAKAVADEIMKYYGVKGVEDDMEIEKIKLSILGNQTEIDGFLVNGRNYVQVSDLLRKLGFKVGWDGNNKTILVDFVLKN